MTLAACLLQPIAGIGFCLIGLNHERLAPVCDLTRIELCYKLIEMERFVANPQMDET
jgi:hypothetical protein